MAETYKEVIKKKIKTLSGEENEEVLNAFLDFSVEIFLNRRYPFGIPKRLEEEPVPKEYYNLIARMGLYLWNKQGADGEIHHTENGVTTSWESGDVPESMLGQIIPLARGI